MREVQLRVCMQQDLKKDDGGFGKGGGSRDDEECYDLEYVQEDRSGKIG